MVESKQTLDLNSCRVCLINKKPLCPLFKYKLSGNYAEMLTAVADVKVASDDGLPDKICSKCCTTLEKAFVLKTIAERSDRRLRKYLARLQSQAPTKKISFNSLVDIKSEIGNLDVKPEPKWEMELEVLGPQGENLANNGNGKDLIIANTVIRKLEMKDEDQTDEFFPNNEDPWSVVKKSIQPEVCEEYLDDNIFQDDDDDDYEPPNPKAKLKKLKMTDAKNVKQINKTNDAASSKSRARFITCYQITKNGARGQTILLKRPKDATVLKMHPNYKQRNSSESSRISVREKPVRVIKTAKSNNKQKEKLVCPVCGILTFTLGNHMNTHQEKKKYTCTECQKTFSQKSNLLTHKKQHTGIKDHICEICGAGFYCQKGLIRHNLIHKGERPFCCTLCPKRFIARCDLNRHLRIHSGYKPFKCNTCTMSFNAKHQLQNHERMHTGERPYSCQVCNVSFSYKVNLNNHVHKVHGVNLKFKSIHTVTEDVVRRELELSGEARDAIAHILPPDAHYG